MFRLLLARAQAACERNSDQCADAGFGWEALAAFAFIGALLCLCGALIGWIWRLLGRFGRFAQVLFVLGLAVFVAMAFNDFRTMGLRAKNGEVMPHLEVMRKAQADYHAKHGVYRAAKRAPQPDAKRALIWPENLPEDSGWAALDWPLAGTKTWCQYEVEVQGDDFVARGLCDVDRDGQFAIFETSKDKPPRRMTPHH
jgi:hypothetical protein